MKASTEWTIWAGALAIVFAVAVLCNFPAKAHDYWETGEPVPPWVKSQCCGPQDIHRLHPSAVHIQADGYHIDGIKTVVPVSRALPSPDGKYYAFWNAIGEPEPVIFCFFAPLNGA